MNKKLLLTLCSFALCQFGFSQENRIVKSAGKTHQLNVVGKSKSTIPTNQAVFFSDDFSVPANWVISNQVGNNDDWVIGTGVPSGSFAIPGITSTTASNGFALFDSDLLCSGNQIADLTLANPVNCTGKPLVTLEFEQFYGRFDDSTMVLVSTDNVNWTAFAPNTAYNNNVVSPTNPELVSIDISSIAANQATVWIRFEFFSPSTYVFQGNPPAPGCGYAWMVDDVTLSAPAIVADGGVASIDAPLSSCSALSATSSVTVTITNFGGVDISNFPVSMTLNGSAPITETFTGTIAVGASASYTFTTTIDLSVLGTYTINAFTGITGDVDATNDGTTTAVNSGGTSLSAGNSYSMDFEPGEDLSLWSTEDVNGDGVTWDLVALVNTFVQNGTQAIRKAGSGLGTIPEDDDWLFTPCLNLTAGTVYGVDYWYKNFELVNPCSLELSIGNAASSTAMTQSIIQNPIPADTAYQNATPTFTVATSGTYYIGFHAFVPAGLGGSSSLRLDNINISEFTSINENSNIGGVTMYPNPTSGLVNLSVKKYNNASLRIMNSIGEVVYSQLLNGVDTKVDMSNFANGLYIMNVLSADFTYTQKITLNK